MTNSINKDVTQKDEAEPTPSFALGGHSSLENDKSLSGGIGSVRNLLTFIHNIEGMLIKSTKLGGVCLKPKAIDIFLNRQPLQDFDHVDPAGCLKMLNEIQLAKLQLSLLSF